MSKLIKYVLNYGRQLSGVFYQHPVCPDPFDARARILKCIPNFQIWLLRFLTSGESRIRQDAMVCGLMEDRLILTDVDGKEEHVTLAGLGNVFFHPQPVLNTKRAPMCFGLSLI